MWPRATSPGSGDPHRRQPGLQRGQLRGLFDLDTGGWLSWYTKSDRYRAPSSTPIWKPCAATTSAAATSEFRIDSTQVAIAPEKDAMSITINVTEGKRYVVRASSSRATTSARTRNSSPLIAIKAGQPYNAEDVAQTTKAFTEFFGGFGLRLRASRPGRRSTVPATGSRWCSRPSPRAAPMRRISVEGNNRTRDEVIRASSANSSRPGTTATASSSRATASTGWAFTQVAVDTVEVPDAPDQVDLVVNVVEKPTGNLTLGAGFAGREAVAIAGIQQENLFGSGNYLGLNVNTSKYNRQLVLSTTDPYFTPDGVSRTFDPTTAPASRWCRRPAT